MTQTDNTSSNSSRSTEKTAGSARTGASPRPGVFSIENLGCSKNQVDAEILIAVLEKEGWRFAEDPGKADLVIVNSCGFIEQAKEESINTCLELRALYPEKRILLAGCLAQRYGQGLLSSLPEIDGVFGNKDLALAVPAAAETLAGGRPALLPEEAPGGEAALRIRRTRNLSFPGSVYIKIAEGCGNNCTYCAIPLIRGPLRSRRREDILMEIAAFAREGVREFNLVGQDLSAYGKDLAAVRGGTVAGGYGGYGLKGLLEDIAGLPGDFWVRLLYIHPDNFPREILETIRQTGAGEGGLSCRPGRPRILPYFDLPFQHASGKILARMGRRGDKEAYLDLIREIREALPDAVLRSTLMTGFPGEGEQDFRELLDFQEKARLDWLGVFAYSREEDTPAWGYTGGLRHRLGKPRAEKRKGLLETLQTPISQERMDRFVGRELEILVEEKVENEDLYFGRGWLQAPEVDGLTVVRARDLSPGTMVKTKIIKRNGIDLEARPLYNQGNF